MPLHSDLEFEAELQQLHAALRELGERAGHALGLALSDLTGKAGKRGGSLRAAVAGSARLVRSTDQLCLRILALRQPTASDLRLVVVALKANMVFDRLGRLSFKLAGRSRASGDKPLKSSGNLSRLAEQVEGVLALASSVLVEESRAGAMRVRAARRKASALERKVLEGKHGDDPRVAIAVYTLTDVADAAGELADLVPFLHGVNPARR